MEVIITVHVTDDMLDGLASADNDAWTDANRAIADKIHAAAEQIEGRGIEIVSLEEGVTIDTYEGE